MGCGGEHIKKSVNLNLKSISRLLQLSFWFVHKYFFFLQAHLSKPVSEYSTLFLDFKTANITFYCS